MRTVVCTVAALSMLLPWSGVRAQPVGEAAAAAAPSSRALQLSRRYVDLVQPPEQMEAMIATTSPPADDPRLAELRDDHRETMRDVIPKIREATIVAYARLYSIAELEALVRFYETPEGRSVIRKTPEVAAAVRDASFRLLDESRAKRCKADPASFACPRLPPPEPRLKG